MSDGRSSRSYVRTSELTLYTVYLPPSILLSMEIYIIFRMCGIALQSFECKSEIMTSH